MYLAVLEELEVALHQDCPLDGESGSEEVEDHSTEAIEAEKRQQTAEADEDHHLHVGEVGIVSVESVFHGFGHVVLHLSIGIVVVCDEEGVKHQKYDFQHQHQRREAHPQAGRRWAHVDAQ